MIVLIGVAKHRALNAAAGGVLITQTGVGIFNMGVLNGSGRDFP
jgi:hypothetical protein